MEIIIFAILVILVICLIIWGLSYLTALPAVPRQIIMALVVILGAVLIAQRAGIF